MHYYDSQGQPRHFEGKNGKPTTLREARKLDLLPSVTTIQKVRSAPQLRAWIAEQAVIEAVTGGWLDGSMAEHMKPELLAKKICQASREKVFAKADDGTEIHDALEVYFTRPIEPSGSGFTELCASVDKLLRDKTGSGRFSWMAERSFANTEFGFAGKCDLHNEHWVIDFKTKDGDVSGVKGYKDQAEQLAAYAHGLKVPNARLANVFISRDRELWGTEQGVSFYEHKDDNAWNRFYHTLLLWQVCNKFGPMYEATQKAA